MGTKPLEDLIGTWAHPVIDFPLNPESTALMLVDMQYLDAHPDFGMGKAVGGISTPAWAYYFGRLTETVIPNNQRLLTFFRQHNLRVVYITLGAESESLLECTPLQRMKFSFRKRLSGVNFLKGTPEHQILAELAPREGELVINKTTASPFNCTAIETILKNLKVDTLIITGVATNACVETTARDAAERGFWCSLIDDACATFDPSVHEVTLQNFRAIFGKVQTVNEVLRDLRDAIRQQRELEPGAAKAGSAT